MSGQNEPLLRVGTLGAARITPSALIKPARDVHGNPKSYAAHIAYARYLLQLRDFTGAIHEFG